MTAHHDRAGFFRRTPDRFQVQRNGRVQHCRPGRLPEGGRAVHTSFDDYYDFVRGPVHFFILDIQLPDGSGLDFMHDILVKGRANTQSKIW